MALRLDHIEAALRLLRKSGASRVVLFGSAVDDPASARDLDLACEGIPFWTLLSLRGILNERLDIPVDLVPLKRDSPFGRHIERWGKVLYERGEAA